MNWTASLLRNELKKQKETYESRLNLLTEASLDAQNYLDLEEKLKVLEANLEVANENLAKLKSEVELKEKLKETELKEQEAQIAKLEKKIVASKELIFNLRKEIRTNQLYYQRNLRTEREKYETKLKTQTKQLRDEITLLNSSETDQQRELQERAKLIIKLEEQVQEKQQELEFANSKVKQLGPLFNQVLTVIKKNVILRGKKELKEAIANIQELMEWEKSPLVTETNTPEETTKPFTDKEQKWRNINLNFTEELINQWENKGFSYEKADEWVDKVGLSIKDANYAWWLENKAEFQPLSYLNETSQEEQTDLKKQFEEYKQSK